MKSQVGLWIDYREAVIVTLNDEIEEIEHVISDVESFVSDADAQNKSHQDRQKRHFDKQLGEYYGKLITIIHNAGSILIFGPAQAKYEFHKKLDRRGLSEHIVAVETTDSMTEAQIVAKIREHFVIQ